MKSPTASKGKWANKSRGFTLVEMLVVIGIIVLVGGMGLFFGFDSFFGYSFRANQDTLISALQHARSRAVSNICYGSCTDGRPHGVKIFPDHLVIFQGDDYEGRSTAEEAYDVELEVNPNTTFTFSGLAEQEVVFSQLSGDVADPGDIELGDISGKVFVISINSEGQIEWETD